MSVAHVILGRPWLFDRDVYHCGKENTYCFMFNDEEIVLKPMSDEKMKRHQRVKPNNVAGNKENISHNETEKNVEDECNELEMKIVVAARIMEFSATEEMKVVEASVMEETTTEESSIVPKEEEQRVVQPEKSQEEAKELEKSKHVVDKSGQQVVLGVSDEEKSLAGSKGVTCGVVTKGINNSIANQSMLEANEAVAFFKEYYKVVLDILQTTTQPASQNLDYWVTFQTPLNIVVESIETKSKDEILLPLNTASPSPPLDAILEEVGQEAVENALLNEKFKEPASVTFVAAKNVQEKLEECDQEITKKYQIGERSLFGCDISQPGMKDGLPKPSVVAIDFVMLEKFNWRAIEGGFSIALLLSPTK